MQKVSHAWIAYYLSFAVSAFILAWFFLVQAPRLSPNPVAYRHELMRALIVVFFLCGFGLYRLILDLLNRARYRSRE